MIILEKGTTGYHLTVTTDGAKLRVPTRANTKDRDYNEFIGFMREVVDNIGQFHKTTVRGRAYITKTQIRITMYNCNKSLHTTVIQNRETGVTVFVPKV